MTEFFGVPTWLVKLAIGINVVIYLGGFRLAKGNWGDAMWTGFLAPLLLLPIFVVFTGLIGIPVVAFLNPLIEVLWRGDVGEGFYEFVACQAGYAGVLGLLVPYWISEHGMIGTPVSGYMGLPSSKPREFAANSTIRGRVG